MRSLQCILALNVVLILVSLANAQFYENNYDDNDDEISNETEDDEGLYVDNRIDESPTFVSPVEKFVKAVTNGADNGIGRLISGITKPIRNIVSGNPAGRAVKSGFGEVLNMIGDRFKAIYPGRVFCFSIFRYLMEKLYSWVTSRTNGRVTMWKILYISGTAWCGAGDVAKSSDEVGLFSMTDNCCRAHDHCNSNINAGESDHGLRNNGIFTRSHCQCDANFYHCLKDVRSIVATNIGITYFNILRPQCFKLEYPAHCVRYGRSRLRSNKCLDYDYDYSQNKTWQWFDSPDFL
ncbi:hypothetical protein TSAR_002628 [Trichomalopsis sarcophagae]|uniref:Phospholipase A2 n=1 Tax=Trichomalopsis sarcophagae TaxID=543379 RepID=A0A232FBB4_9HYME|nr:hypothetical protein TSAR_002628 [Trichomalopsis sarcophagae]